MRDMNLALILRGTEIAYDGVQSIQGLTIVPLTCDRSLSFDNRYASPYNHKVSTTSYGVVHLETKDDTRPVLVPPHSTYITKGYAAQDHLISKGAIVTPGRKKTLRDSRCVEASQGGQISSTRNNEHMIAPLTLREIAYNYVGDEGYNKMWDDLQTFNQQHGSGSDKQMKDYFKKWNKELDQFIAHFERIENCIGFITLYKDEVVAVDKFPSFTYTSEIWEKLVRDSYASLVIRDRVMGQPVTSTLKTVSDFAGDRRLKAATIYDRLIKARRDHYRTLMQEVAEIEFTYREDRDTQGSRILDSEGYIGQVIEQNGVNIMVSIVKRSSFDPGKMRDARVMRHAARQQNLFTI